MGRRVRRVPVALNPSDEPPTPDEMDTILLAADEITMSAGRNGLSLILKGSRAAKVFEKGWDRVETYGALAHLTSDQIARKIDWMIHAGWLRIEYDWALPLIRHSEQGWERVQKLWVGKLLGEFETWVAEGRPEQVWPRVETFHRQIKFQLLERIRARRARHLAPVLLAWRPHEVRKVQGRIGDVLRDMGVSYQETPARPARTPRKSWAGLDKRERLDHMADQFAEEASRVQGVEEIAAFGSYVTAKPEPKDLDLMVFLRSGQHPPPGQVRPPPVAYLPRVGGFPVRGRHAPSPGARMRPQAMPCPISGLRGARLWGHSAGAGRSGLHLRPGPGVCPPPAGTLAARGGEHRRTVVHGSSEPSRLFQKEQYFHLA